MLQYTNAVSDRTRPATYTASEAVLKGGDPEAYVFTWCATGRSMVTGSTQPPLSALEATRTSSTVFMRGLKERCEITTNNGLPWQWRRIVFSVKNLWNDFTYTSSFSTVSLTSNGYRRTVNEAWGLNRDMVLSYLFRGTRSLDWNDEITAPIDSRRLTIHYDKVRTIASGNERGVVRSYRMWHPFNKNLVYDDDELGSDEATAVYSVGSKAGMGDVYVIDIFKPRGGSTSSDQLAFGPNATLYWHEK